MIKIAASNEDSIKDNLIEDDSIRVNSENDLIEGNEKGDPTYDDSSEIYLQIGWF